jgi:hypothetical protein
MTASVPAPSPAGDPPDDATVIADTRRWLDRAVIGLNLCPFAKAVVVHDRVGYVVSRARTPEALAADLVRELERLRDTPEDVLETTLLMHPEVLRDFLDFNDFLGVADAALEQLGLDGELQVASFHPDYQFAGTDADDIDNFTNRSPWPTLHLLRESSIERAVAAVPEAADIYERNIETLRRLGPAGWRALWV